MVRVSSSPVRQCEGWNAITLSRFFPFIFLLSSVLSLWLASFRGATECLRLVYEEPWFNQWGLACLREQGEKYEWIFTPAFQTAASTSYSKSLPSSSSLPAGSSATSSHTFSTGMCLCLWERICVKPTAAGGSFLWLGQCVYTDGSQASRGPAPPSSSIPSPKGLCNQPMLSHF